MSGKRRVLIIDDEERFAKLVRDVLERTGAFEVRAEHQAAAGIETAKKFRPELILMDVIMPDADGGEVAAQIRDEDALRNAKIVFFTSAVTKEEVDSSQGTIGGYPMLSKSTSAKDLVHAVHKFLAAT